VIWRVVSGIVGSAGIMGAAAFVRSLWRNSSAGRRVRVKIKVRVEFEPRDCWIGVYWDLGRVIGPGGRTILRLLDVYIGVVPLFPIHLTAAWS
jgi:hypothetical protein